MKTEAKETVHLCSLFCYTIVQILYLSLCKCRLKAEFGPMPIVMVTLPNTGGALCSTPQSLADAHY